MSNWLIYPLSIADQQQHIDTSEHLLKNIQPGDTAILSWSLAEPAGLVLGFSQKESVLNQEQLAAEPLPIYHRRAGGTAVLVGPTLLSLDVVLPADHPLVLPDLIESYRWFGNAWTLTLAELGVSARLVLPNEARAQQQLRRASPGQEYERLMNRACYGSLSAYEVVQGQQKVVGFDMIRRRNGSLLQAGLLLTWDTDILAKLLGHSAEEQDLLRSGLKERAVGLDMLLGYVIDYEKIMSTFERVLLSDQYIC